jgi:hypothetical protein
MGELKEPIRLFLFRFFFSIFTVIIIISCIYLWQKYYTIKKNGKYTLAEIIDVKPDVIENSQFIHTVKYILEDGDTAINSINDDKKHSIKSKLKIIYARDNPMSIELSTENLLLKSNLATIGLILFSGILLLSFFKPKYFLERFKGGIYYAD